MTRITDSISRRKYLMSSAGIAAAGLAGCLGSTEDEFPSEEIRAVCPWAAGGGTDLSMRQLLNIAEEETDAEFYVENVEGGGGANGFREIINSEPDGYTTGVVSPNISLWQFIEQGGDISPDDVAGVMQYNYDPTTFAVHEDGPFGSIDEMVAYAEEGNTIQIGNGGAGTTFAIGGGGFAHNLGILDSVEMVPYDGGAPAVQATVNQEVDAVSQGPNEIFPQTGDRGPLVPLVVMAEDRVDLFPDVPTTFELDIDWSMGVFRAFVAAADTSEDRINALHDILKTAWDTDEYQEWMDENGFGLVHRGPDEFEQHMEDTADRLEPVVEALGLE